MLVRAQWIIFPQTYLSSTLSHSFLGWSKIIPIACKIVKRHKAIKWITNYVDVNWFLPYSKSEKNETI